MILKYSEWQLGNNSLLIKNGVLLENSVQLHRKWNKDFVKLGNKKIFNKILLTLRISFVKNFLNFA